MVRRVNSVHFVKLVNLVGLAGVQAVQRRYLVVQQHLGDSACTVWVVVVGFSTSMKSDLSCVNIREYQSSSHGESERM